VAGIIAHLELADSPRQLTGIVLGLLTCLDGYMNVALEDTEEWAGGRITGRYGDCFLRGNNG